MISTVDEILSNAQLAGEEALQEAIKNLVLALDDSGRKDEYLKNASESQKDAIVAFEKMLEEARKNADAARAQAKLNDIIDRLEKT